MEQLQLQQHVKKLKQQPTTNNFNNQNYSSRFNNN